MAKENVKKFFEEISTNKELQEKFMAAQKGYEAEGKSEEEVFEDIVLPIAKEAGCEFTMSEYKNAQRDAMAEKDISEEELENVSGGGFCCLIGFGTTEGSCMISGLCREYTAEKYEKASETAGIGFNACIYVGIGLGGYF